MLNTQDKYGPENLHAKQVEALLQTYIAEPSFDEAD
jgi:hypothetical protein